MIFADLPPQKMKYNLYISTFHKGYRFIPSITGKIKKYCDINRMRLRGTSRVKYLHYQMVICTLSIELHLSDEESTTDNNYYGRIIPKIHILKS